MVRRTGEDHIVEDMHVTKSEETQPLNPNPVAHTHTSTHIHIFVMNRIWENPIYY